MAKWKSNAKWGKSKIGHFRGCPLWTIPVSTLNCCLISTLSTNSESIHWRLLGHNSLKPLSHAYHWAQNTAPVNRSGPSWRHWLQPERFYRNEEKFGIPVHLPTKRKMHIHLLYTTLLTKNCPQRCGGPVKERTCWMNKSVRQSLTTGCMVGFGWQGWQVTIKNKH